VLLSYRFAESKIVILNPAIYTLISESRFQKAEAKRRKGSVSEGHEGE
jgi:hypothetical protein